MINTAVAGDSTNCCTLSILQSCTDEIAIALKTASHIIENKVGIRTTPMIN